MFHWDSAKKQCFHEKSRLARGVVSNFGQLGKEILVFLTRWPMCLGNLDFPYQMADSVRESGFSLPDSRFGKEILFFLTRWPIW